MPLLIFTLVLLVAGFLLQIFCKRRTRWFQYLLFVAFLGIFGFYFYLVYAQYLTWRDAGPPSSYLVPPHASISYVFGYHFFRFGLYYLISFGVATLFFFAARFLNRKFEERFFDREEPYLGALSIFLLGNPAWNYAWMYYLVLVLFLSVVGSLFTQYVFRVREPRTTETFGYKVKERYEELRDVDKKSGGCKTVVRDKRFPLYFLWIPCALGVILIAEIL